MFGHLRYMFFRGGRNKVKDIQLVELSKSYSILQLSLEGGRGEGGGGRGKGGGKGEGDVKL